MLVEDDWGRGKVVYLALDAGRPPLSAWSGLPKLLESLLAPATGDKSSVRPQWNETIFSQLLLGPSFVSSYIPTRALFFSILGYLAGIVVLGRLWQRRRVGLRVLAALCCGWIVCAAAAGYFFFTRDSLTQDGVLLEASVLESAGDGYVDAQTNVALFSTQRREYSLGFGRGWLDLMPLPAPSHAQPEQSLVYRHGGGVTRVQLPLQQWDYRLLRTRSVERLGLSATIEQQDGRLSLKVKNESGRALTDCWLVAPGMRVALGDLASGESWAREFPLGGDGGAQNSGRDPDQVSLRDMTFKEKPHEILFHRVLPAGRRGRPLAQEGGAFFRLGERSRAAARCRRPAYPAAELRALPRDRAAYGGGRMNPVLRDSLEVFFREGHGLPPYFYLLAFLAPIEFLALCTPFLGAQMWSGTGNLVRDSHVRRGGARSSTSRCGWRTRNMRHGGSSRSRTGCTSAGSRPGSSREARWRFSPCTPSPRCC